MMNIEAKFEELRRMIELAGTYMDEGALRDSANRLRKAADIADELAEIKDQAILESLRPEGAKS